MFDMKNTYTLYLYLGLCLCMIFFPKDVFSQLDPLQPEQDCFSAIAVCQDVFIQTNSYTGEGQLPNEIDSDQSCLNTGERNDVWYIFTIQDAGELSFTITPNVFIDDYDWAVYNLTNAQCSDIFSDPSLEVSCNWSFVAGATGANGQGQGGFFNPFNPTIPVLEGETYVLNVSNFSSTNFGYTLDFSASTAQIFDNQPADLSTQQQLCSGDNLRVGFSENVVCSSIQTTDFRIEGPDGAHRVLDLGASNCNAGASFERGLELTLDPPLTVPGAYTLDLVDEIEDLCGNISINQRLNFQVESIEPDFMVNGTSLCQDTCVVFTYTGTDSAGLTFQWDFGVDASPATSPLKNPPCVDYGSGGSKTVSLTVSSATCSQTISKTIDITPFNNLDLGIDRTICEGEDSVQLQVNVPPGDTLFTLEWKCTLPNSADCGISDPFAFDPMVSPNIALNDSLSASVTYYIDIVTLPDACVSANDSVVVELRPRPIADAGPDRTICANDPGAILLGGVADENLAPGPFLYSWSPADGLSSPDARRPRAKPADTTEYTLVVTSFNGCTSRPDLDTTASVWVNVNELPIVEAGNDTTICEGDTIQLMGQARLAGERYTYVWTPANTGYMSDEFSAAPRVSPNFSTTFFFIATSDENGCSSLADSVKVGIDPSPVIAAGLPEAICLGESVQLKANSLNDPDGSQNGYTWTPAESLSDPNVLNPFAQPDTTTTYTLQSVSPLGCNSNETDFLVVVKPSPIVDILTPDTSSCEGETIVLDAQAVFTSTPFAPVNFFWQPDSSIDSDIGLDRVQVSPTETTDYIVVASIGGDCPSRDTVTVKVTESFMADLLADSLRICRGSSVAMSTIGAPPGSSITWTPAESLNSPTILSPMASPDTTTTYVAIVEFEACKDTLSRVVEVIPTPEADYFASETAGCEGLQVNFFENTNDAVAYIWDFGDGSPVSNEANPSHTYMTSGNYTVTLTALGQNGCATSVSNLNVDIAAPVVAEFTGEPSLDLPLFMPNARINFTDLSTNATSWVWDFGDGQGSTESSPGHIFTESGLYTIKLVVSGDNGCSDERTAVIQILEPELFIPNVFTPNGDGIHDTYVVEYFGKETFWLEIFDRWGKRQFSTRSMADVWDGRTPEGTEAKAGVYYYQLSIGQKTYTGDITLLR